jgi:hypothetical protein
MSEFRTPEAEIDYLRGQITAICKEFYDFFDDRPNESGYYTHLGICSGDRRKPIGSNGCCCKNSKVFKRQNNPHDWILTEETRIPERGLNWNTYECQKCNWKSTIHRIDLSIEELNSHGWCPTFEDEKTS